MLLRPMNLRVEDPLYIDELVQKIQQAKRLKFRVSPSGDRPYIIGPKRRRAEWSTSAPDDAIVYTDAPLHYSSIFLATATADTKLEIQRMLVDILGPASSRQMPRNHKGLRYDFWLEGQLPHMIYIDVMPLTTLTNIPPISHITRMAIEQLRSKETIPE